MHWTKDPTHFQFFEIQKVYQIIMHKILRVGTQLIHVCSLLCSLIFIYKSHYVYLFFFILRAWYALRPRILWIHSLFSTRTLQEMPTSWEVVVFKTRMPTSWGVFFNNLLVGDWLILCSRKQAFQGTPRTSQHIASCQEQQNLKN